MKKCSSSCGCAGSWVAWALLIIGGLNWALVGIGILAGGNWNVVNLLVGSIPWLEAIVYFLVGLSALVVMFGCCCKKCTDCKDGKCNDRMDESANGMSA